MVKIEEANKLLGQPCQCCGRTWTMVALAEKLKLGRLTAARRIAALRGEHYGD